MSVRRTSEVRRVRENLWISPDGHTAFCTTQYSTVGIDALSFPVTIR